MGFFGAVCEPPVSGDQGARGPAVVAIGDVAGFGRIRHLCGIIAPALIVLFWAVAAQAAETPTSQLSDDVALTKATISSLAAKDFAVVRNRLDPWSGGVSDQTIRQMSDVIGAQEPLSIETISSTEARNLQTGDGNSRILLEYGLPGKWVVVDAVVRTKAGAKQFTRFYFNVNALPLRELNAFHFFGKGPVQYLSLVVWLAAIMVTVWAMIVAFKRHGGWRRWALIVSMPMGLTPTVAVNWNTAQVWVLEAISNSAGYSVPIFAFRYPMALFGYTETHALFLYVSAPLIALGYLIWHWRWSQRRHSVGLDVGQAT